MLARFALKRPAAFFDVLTRTFHRIASGERPEEARHKRDGQQLRDKFFEHDDLLSGKTAAMPGCAWHRHNKVLPVC
jgi:hypothetical protein